MSARAARSLLVCARARALTHIHIHTSTQAPGTKSIKAEREMLNLPILPRREGRWHRRERVGEGKGRKKEGVVGRVGGWESRAGCEG